MKMRSLTRMRGLQMEKVAVVAVLVGPTSSGHYSYSHVVVLVETVHDPIQRQVAVGAFQVVSPSLGHLTRGLVAILSEDLPHCSIHYSCPSSSSSSSSCNNKPKEPKLTKATTPLHPILPRLQSLHLHYRSNYYCLMRNLSYCSYVKLVVEVSV